LKELAESIKIKGIIQPLIVRKKEDKYEIVAGSRRYYAAKLLGIKELPSIIRELDDKDTLVFSIIENLQRQDLDPIEEAQSYKRLMEEFGLSYEDVARLVGKDRTTIVNTLRLLNLPEVIQQALQERKITASSARTLLGIEDKKEQLEIFEKMLREEIPVRKLEEIVRRKKRGKKRKDIYIDQLEEELRKTLGRKVKIVSYGKRGRIIIEYYSEEDLESLLKILRRK